MRGFLQAGTLTNNPTHALAQRLQALQYKIRAASFNVLKVLFGRMATVSAKDVMRESADGRGWVPVLYPEPARAQSAGSGLNKECFSEQPITS